MGKKRKKKTRAKRSGKKAKEHPKKKQKRPVGRKTMGKAKKARKSSVAEEVIHGLREAGIAGLLVMGDTSQPVGEVTVEMNKIGMIILGGLNPVAAALEAGIEAENYAMSTVIDYQDLKKFKEL